MADRFLLKQFAGSASNNGIFGSAQQGAGVVATDIKQVQSLNAFENGWNSATVTADKLPCLEEFQGVQALLCKAIKENYSEGIPQWLSTETYYVDSFCVYQNKIYRNKTGTSTTNNPALDTTNWEEFTAGKGDDVTIFKNTDEELEARGVLNAKDTATGLKIWKGTKAEYDAITTKDPNTLYMYPDPLSPTDYVTVTTTQTITGDKNFTGITTAITQLISDNSTKVATTAFAHLLLPTGTVLPYAGSTVPTGFLLCDGSAISRTTYADLFSAIGTAYGSGDGNTTFNIPNYSERTLWQNSIASLGATTVGELPNITGNVFFDNTCIGVANGAFNTGGVVANQGIQPVATATRYQAFDFDASRSSSIYKSGTALVRPAYCSNKFIIKY